MLAGYKTYIVAGVAVLSTVASYLVGDIGLTDAIQIIVPAIIGATVRHGITTTTTIKK